MSNENGFELGGTAGTSFALSHGFDPVAGSLTGVSGTASFGGLLTRRGPGAIRSLDFSGEITVSGNSPSGGLTLGLDTDNLRVTASGVSLPGLGLPAMIRLGLERRPFTLDADGDWRLGWNTRLGYVVADELTTLAHGESSRAPSDILAGGASLHLTSEHDWGNFHLTTDHELGLDLFGRIASGPYLAGFEVGHGTTLPHDTLAGVGGAMLAGTIAAGYDLELGRGFILRPMLSHDLRLELSDPTIAPHIVTHDLAAGARLNTPFGLTFSGATELGLSPDLSGNVELLPAGVITSDYRPTDWLTLGADLRFDADGVRNAGGTVAAAITPDLSLSGSFGHGRRLGTTGTIGLEIGFGGERRAHGAATRSNPLTGNVDPTRPHDDSRGEDRRYRARTVRVEESFVTELSTASADEAATLLESPERVAAALDPDLTFPGRGALPGQPAPAHPSRRDLHRWAAAILTGRGIEARVVGVAIDHRPDTIVVYRDPWAGLWRVMDGHRVADTRAESPEQAVLRFCRGAGAGASPWWQPADDRAPATGPDHDDMRRLHDTIDSEDLADFSALGDLSEASYKDLVSRARALAATDPEATPRAIVAMLGPEGPFTYGFHPGELLKIGPEETWARKTDVICAEYHVFAARLLREAGIQAHPVEIFSPGLAHVITVFRDPQTGKWNVADYNTLYTTGADSPEQAVAAYDPTYYQMILFDDAGGLPATRAVLLSPRARTMRDFMRRPR